MATKVTSLLRYRLMNQPEVLHTKELQDKLSCLIVAFTLLKKIGDISIDGVRYSKMDIKTLHSVHIG